jgi:predicted AAA+ superfamily ATPase
MVRRLILPQIELGFATHPILALLGPRQCGKTTLALQYGEVFRKKNGSKSLVHHFDLENPPDLARLESPAIALEPLRGLIIIDEIQRRPELFPYLRVLADRKGDHARFLILGSASRDLIRQSSESLAGRISYLELPPFSLGEARQPKRLWLRGGFPRSYLASDRAQSMSWRQAYISTYLERDLPTLGIQIPAPALRRFWMMLAHYNAQLFNSSELGRSLGISDTTTRRYLDILTGTFMVRQLQPWAENISKRQVKTPKIYFRDTGIFHALLGIRSLHDLYHHPKLGASWESFALETVIRHHHAAPEEVYFWATHNEAELDLLIPPGGMRGPKRRGFEFKYTDRPKVTRSMRIAIEDLKLDSLQVVFPGKERFWIEKGIEAVGLENFALGAKLR